MYGGKARNLFRRTIVKSAWFSVITAQMNSQGGTTVDFGSEYQAVFSRTADYILNCMLNQSHTHTLCAVSAFSVLCCVVLCQPSILPTIRLGKGHPSGDSGQQDGQSALDKVQSYAQYRASCESIGWYFHVCDRRSGDREYPGSYSRCRRYPLWKPGRQWNRLP